VRTDHLGVAATVPGRADVEVEVTAVSVQDPMYYWDYLGLDEVLGSQQLASASGGREPAHDELLFIVTHQAFELWFKQILWELDPVLDTLGSDPVPEPAMGQVVHRLERIVAILPLLVQQFQVLETMTPLDFLDFRDELIPASGFQSVQFRLIENRLGVDPQWRLKIKGARYTSRLSRAHAAQLDASESEPTLVGVLDAWLARTPFLRFGSFDFWAAYRDAVETMIERDRHLIATNPSLDDVVRQQQLDAFEVTSATFATLFDPAGWEELRASGKRRLSHDAFLAALLISLYRDEPALHLPFRLLTALVDLDQGFTAFRNAHAALVERSIGGRIGTGGTSGHEYLAAAARKHRVFTDLMDLATYHLPRKELPPLPDEVREQMSFRYVAG
jgi:tryptophan 2,3-dioxygenase